MRKRWCTRLRPTLEKFSENRIEPEKRKRTSANVMPVTPKLADFHGGFFGYEGAVVTASGPGVADSNLICEGRKAKEQQQRNFECGGADGAGSSGGPGGLLRLDGRGGSEASGQEVGYALPIVEGRE